MNRFLIPSETSIPYVLRIYKGLRNEFGEILKGISISTVIIFYRE